MSPRATRLCGALALCAGVGVACFGAQALVALGRAQNWIQTGRADPLPCSFRARTGQPCLGCGGTRALELAARGELRAAARQNPLGAWAALVAWLTAACAAAAVWSGNGAWLKRAACLAGASAPLAFAWTFVWWWRFLPSGPPGP